MIEAAVAKLTPAVTSAPTSGTTVFVLICDAIEDTFGVNYTSDAVSRLLLDMAKASECQGLPVAKTKP